MTDNQQVVISFTFAIISAEFNNLAKGHAFGNSN